MDINSLRKSRGLDFSKITTALSKSTESGYKSDEDEFFKLTKDKAGNASAVIRFLNTTEGDDLPWVQIYSHAFQGPTGKWYIENCLSTLGKDDPVNEANRILWAGTDEDKAVAKQRKRKLSYYANILVVSDPANRENEGKVFKFKFGKKIFEKITEKLQPTFEDEKPINVFDYWDGANFKLRMRQVEGYPNYDQSAFADPSPITESDEELLAIVKQQKPLRELIDPSKFKSYDELKKKLESVVSGVTTPSRAMEDAPVAEPKVTTKPKAAKVEAPVTTEGDDEDMDAFFKSIE